jgi:hypothetical protein
MSLPGNRLPPHEGGSSTPADNADPMPVYCRHGVGWSWVGSEGGFVCDDPTHYDGPVPVEPGAIPAEHQPYFAHPPNPAQRAALEIYDEP